MEPASQMIPFVELKHVYLPYVSVFDVGNTPFLDCSVTQETDPYRSPQGRMVSTNEFK